MEKSTSPPLYSSNKNATRGGTRAQQVIDTQDRSKKSQKLFSKRLFLQVSQSFSFKIMESKASQSISFNILVEKEKNRVVFVESNKDFVDIIFSFMTMPIGTIIRLAREHSLKGEIGCLKNLYGSVENLNEEHFKSGFKEIILNPRSAAEIYCRNLKLNLNGSNNSKYYVCRSGNCSFVSCTESACCRCGNPLELEVILSLAPEDDTGFVKPTARFMITDDFQVLPMSTMTGLSLLSKLGVMDGSKIEERTVNIGKDEVLKLLNCSLASRTPFSDTFMQPPIDKTNVVIHHGEYGQRTDKPQSDMNTTAKHSKINLKLIIHKSNKRALYAEVEENFIELLCSLLVLPIGYVFKEFPSLHFKGCMDNIYKSIQDFGDDKFFQSEEMKAILVDPKLAPGLACCNKLIGIEEAINPSFSTFRSFFTTRCSELSSKPPPGEAKMSSGFMKGPSMFMVTDNLLIKPISPISGISLMNRLKVPLSDVGELEVTMGKDEALRLLVASLISGSALTNAFKSFMLKEPQQEP